MLDHPSPALSVRVGCSSKVRNSQGKLPNKVLQIYQICSFRSLPVYSPFEKVGPQAFFCEGVKIKLTAVSSYFSDILAHFPHVAQDAISFLLPFGKLQKSWANEIDLVELVLTVIRMRWTLLNLSCRALLDTLVSHNPSNGSDFSKMICLDLPIHSLLHGFNTAVAE